MTKLLDRHTFETLKKLIINWLNYYIQKYILINKYFDICAILAPSAYQGATR